MNSAATRATHPRTNPGGPSGTSTPEEERLIRLASHVWTRDCRPDSGQGIRCARPVPDQPHDHLHARWPALSATTRGVIPGAWLYMRNFIQREWRLERIIVRSVSSRFSLTRSAPRCAGRTVIRAVPRPGLFSGRDGTLPPRLKSLFACGENGSSRPAFLFGGTPVR